MILKKKEIVFRLLVIRNQSNGHLLTYLFFIILNFNRKLVNVL